MDLVFEGRSLGLEGDDGFYEIGSRVADAPAIRTALGVGNQYAGSDLVEERRIGVDDGLGKGAVVGCGLDLAGVELVERGITNFSSTGPLGCG